jgi:hypothetical protein
MKNFKALLFALCVLACASVAPVYAAHKTPSHDASPQTVLAVPAFQKMLESGSPSAADNLALAKLTGEWHCKEAVWAVPGAEPKWTTGVSRNEMTLDNRFLSSVFVGELDVGGNDAMINGKDLIGYDTVRKSFTSVWLDTMTTGMMIGAGKYDKKANAIKETGQFTNPLTRAESRFRSELQFTGDDDYKRTIFAVDRLGKETKLMEFDCSKRP